jgi:hypothetical protein
MDTLDKKYTGMKQELSDYLDVTVSPEQKDIESWVFDSMVRLRDDYDSLMRAKSELRKTVDDVASNYDNANAALELIIEKTQRVQNLESRLGIPKDEKMPAPAFIFVLNYNPDSKLQQQHTFNGDWYKQDLRFGTDEAYNELKEVAYMDNAVLIDKEGKLLARKVLLTELDPNKVVKRNGMNEHSSVKMSRALGFRDNQVNARNKNSLAFSEHVYEKDNSVVVYVLAEETGNIRRMVNGVITHSTVPQETNYSFLKELFTALTEGTTAPVMGYREQV